MRLWSLSSEYLDRQGLVACWREALLAREVLEGKTIGYKNHPQLLRFKNCPNPLGAINYYLANIYFEGNRRGYKFEFRKLDLTKNFEIEIPVTDGQVFYEWVLLQNKLKKRSEDKFYENARTIKPKVHPLFKIIKGEIESWEKVK